MLWGCQHTPDMNLTRDEAIQCVWDYHQLGHELAPSDAIFALGSHDLRVADRAAELYHQRLAPWVICSGGFGNLTRNRFVEPEADLFARRVGELGVPLGAVLIENQSTNTGENVRFTRKLLVDRALIIRSVVAVQKPYMERRTYATLRAQWPEVEVRVTSPRLSFEEYCAQIPREDVVHIMVGDLQRIMVYPRLGFMIEQEVPPPVRAAFDLLLAAGYTRHLVRLPGIHSIGDPEAAGP